MAHGFLMIWCFGDSQGAEVTCWAGFFTVLAVCVCVCVLNKSTVRLGNEPES